MGFSNVPEVLEEIRQGRIVVVVDDENRENEGDLVMAAERVTPDAINFMAKYGRGLICMPIVGERLDELEIPIMVPRSGDHMGTAFTVSVDSCHCTTGISAYERAMTIKAILDPASRPQDLVRPGHIFPLRAKEGGVLRRPGHTEAAVDLARMAGLYPAGICCEIMNEDGTMARLSELMEFARHHGLKIVTIEEIIKYRLHTDRLVRRISTTVLPTAYGDFRLHAYEDLLSGKCHVALVKGDLGGEEPVLVRVHSECLTGDTFASLRCDCGEQLERSLQLVQEAGRGVVLYMRQEGRGIGLANKIRAYALQDAGLDTVEANVQLGLPPDARDYGTGAQILADLGVHRMLLLTNNPKKYAALAGYGLEIVERIPIEVKPNHLNLRYLRTKREKLGHILHGLD